ncbi:MAG TPA: ParB-like protein [Candidatus Nitrosotenuis sp.]|nr:ParB-like protein [Candidatus Nitrosotenuis sp.]
MTKSDTVYISPTLLLPSQVRYSRRNVEDKITLACQRGDVYFDLNTKTYHFRYDHDKSMFSLQDPVHTIKTQQGLVLADGHHSVLASLALGCKTIPILSINHWNGPINEDFWRWAEEKNYAYRQDLDGRHLPVPYSFLALKDDPLRYFAAISARKFEVISGKLTSRGADYPLWVKIGRDIAFTEMRIANELYQAGFRYHYGQETAPDFSKMIEKARQILKNHPIDGLKFMPTREHYLESTLIQQWLSKEFSPNAP